jgi:hypothetical protein
MSKKKNKITPKLKEVFRPEQAAGQFEIPDSKVSRLKNLLSYLKAHTLMVGIIGLVAFGVLGSGLKYLDEDAQREIARRANNKGNLNNHEQSFMNKVNPFLPPPDPVPTPQLSKEYTYAGSRLLAVEDANANFAPPADLAIWRPNTENNTCTWWIMANQNLPQITVQWGNPSDTVVPGDYDGDGKTDFSIFRPSTNTWWILRSSDNGYSSNTFGSSGDKVAPGDYDGDGKTDLAVFRPSTGTWYIFQSSTYQTVTAQFGMSGDVPASADYDGDGKADIAIWRNSTTQFYSINSSNGTFQTPPAFGQSGEPVSADYDGDGKANFAIQSSSNWMIMNNAYQVQTTPWQSAGDKPVQNDYDSDGKVDVAVWHESTGTWYIRQSSRIGQSDELRQVNWGTVGDTPVPAFYKR